MTPDYVVLPRRHGARTMGLLLRWYIGAGMLGLLVATAIAYAFYLIGIAPTSERFAGTIVATLPLGAIALWFIWGRVVHPRIRADREAEHAAVEAFLRQRNRYYDA